MFSSVMLDAAVTWEFKRTEEIASSKISIQPSVFRAPSAVSGVPEITVVDSTCLTMAGSVFS